MPEPVSQIVAQMPRGKRAGLESFRLYRRWPGQLGESPTPANPHPVGALAGATSSRGGERGGSG